MTPENQLIFTPAKLAPKHFQIWYLFKPEVCAEDIWDKWDAHWGDAAPIDEKRYLFICLPIGANPNEG